MAQEVTLGGDRLGSGGKMKQELHNYGMNSFNQDRDWKSTCAPGILYPCFKEIGTNFGTFDIDIDTFVRTLPTKGPLFGSFKMQVDLFNVPFRLYQGILHNNPTDIGLNMHQVLLPKIAFRTKEGKNAPRAKGSNDYSRQVNESSLEKYLGLSGYCTVYQGDRQTTTVTRKLQCVPELGYYDIFKNYYSNKQEENAYVITPGNPREAQVIERLFTYAGNLTPETEYHQEFEPYSQEDLEIPMGDTAFSIYMVLDNQIQEDDETLKHNITMSGINGEENLEDAEDYGCYVQILPSPTGNKHIIIHINRSNQEFWGNIGSPLKIHVGELLTGVTTADIALTPFALKNIDKMRAKLLSNNEVNDLVTIDAEEADDINIWGNDSGLDQTGLPYIALSKQTDEGITWNAFSLNGLVVKTYQSDIFNNWLDTSFVDTIASRTKIDTTSGGFTPDTLILQEKIYKLLNRILVGGGTYYDWQEATYGEGVAKMCEIPMYIGGMSTEIMFEEVISNSDTNTREAGYQPLGSLGGKGMNMGKKGGNNIHVRMEEPGYIMGILSITPRISQSQGNDWDRVELNSLDDLHKPELDGIGFQDLPAEWMCWWDTMMMPNNNWTRHSVGKQTAWIHYQTAVDKVFGDFAKQEGYSFMVLNRNYEIDGYAGIKDMTTYIDPAKYNYAFAVQDLAAQNFWVQVVFKCTSRRKMGAQQLPNL